MKLDLIVNPPAEILDVFDTNRAMLFGNSPAGPVHEHFMFYAAPWADAWR